MHGYSGIIQAYYEPCVTLTYSELWYIHNLTYSEPDAYSKLWYIQNSGTFRTRDIFRILVYSNPWDVQNRGHTQNLVKHLQWNNYKRNHVEINTKV